MGGFNNREGIRFSASPTCKPQAQKATQEGGGSEMKAGYFSAKRCIFGAQTLLPKTLEQILGQFQKPCPHVFQPLKT